MTTPLIVGAGVDTFVANVKYLDKRGKPVQSQELPPDLTNQLQEWQDAARAQQRPLTTALRFHGAPLLMMMGGSSTWKWVLRNASMEIKCGARLHLGMLAKARLSSEYLWAQPSLDVSLKQLQRFVNGLFMERMYLQAGLVDLCVDLVGLNLPALWEEVFITHAISKRPIGESSKDRAYYGGRKLETLQFSGHGNPMHSKLYNKGKEIQQHSPEKVWFHDLWRARGWNGTDTVWRKEFSIERAALRDMIIQHTCKKPADPNEQHARCVRVESVYDVPANLKRLWSYCTHDWLRMVVPQTTKNRKRWPTDPAWTLLQGAFDEQANPETDAWGPIIRKRKREKNLERATAAIAGYASTYGGWDETVTEEDDISVVFGKIYDGVVQRLEERGVDFAAKMQEKRERYSIPPVEQKTI
jgi:hypothetical protein